MTNNTSHRVERRFKMMGGPACIVIDTAKRPFDNYEPLLDALLAELTCLETRYSRFRTDSLISTINRRAGSGIQTEIDTEMSTLLNFAGELWAASDGLFDITSGVLRKAWDFQRGGNASPTQLAECLPKVGWDLVEYKNDAIYLPLQGMQIDLGGIVKEYAADCVAASIREAGITSALIELAGDVVVIGGQGNGKPWQIGIRDPDSSGSLLTLSLQDAAVATSGDYARTIKHNGRALSHFLNPRTGWPVNGPITVSVLDQRCLTAGAIATVACLKTDSHAQAWLEEAGLPWLMMKSCGTLIDTLTNPVSQRESLTSLQTLQLSH